MVDTPQPSTASATLRAARLERELLDELQLQVSEIVLEELAFARYVERHEGRRPTYGAIVWNEALARVHGGVPPLPSAGGFLDAGAPLTTLRQFADGRTSFIVRGDGVSPALAIDQTWNGSESVMAGYAVAANVTVIQRLASGRVRLFQNERVFSEEGGMWLARPTAASYHSLVSQVVRAELHDVARALLELCVHTLSPSGTGATLVWFPSGTTKAHLDLSVAVDPPGLSCARAEHAPSIAHALGQMDRAVLVDELGFLTHLNVTLEGNASFAGQAFAGGTRHNSAGHYSASTADAIVFVVSADGPVTVFRDGTVVASIA